MAGKLKNYNSSFGVNKYPGIFFKIELKNRITSERDF